MEIVTMPHDGVKIAVHIWDRVDHPKGVVQFLHGMNEHMGRYEEFAKYLNACGYILVGDDHRAHGQTAGSPALVGIVQGRGDIFEDTVRDEIYLTHWISARFALPVLLCGHSYGSFLLQRYMFGNAISEEVAGIVLIGAAKLPKRLTAAGKFCTIGEPNHPANTIVMNTFCKYDKRFKEGRNCWLTKDRDTVKKYNQDPFVKEALSHGFFHSFFSGAERIFLNPDTDSLKNLPILILCGKKDGMGGYGKYSKALYEKMISLGLRDVNFTLYPTDRHEVLNENDRVRVFGDLVEHLDRCIADFAKN